MIDEATYEAMIAKARETDRTRTADEHDYGLASPSDGGFEILLRTTKDALECAIKTEDWQTVCEAMVFLQQALGMLTQPMWPFSTMDQKGRRV